MNIKMTGELIKKLREEKKISQYKLAEDLFIDRTAIAKWENGRSLPSPEMLVSLSNYFHITIDELIYGEIKTEENVSNINRLALNLFFEKHKLIIIIKIISFFLMFTILSFLIYYFITTYNSIKIYKVDIDSDEYELIDSYFIKTRDKIYMNLKTNLINSENIRYIEIFYKNENIEKMVYSTNNIQNIMIVDYLGYEEYFDFKKLNVILGNLYIKIEYANYKEIFKLNLKKDYSNSNFLLNVENNISDKKIQKKNYQKVNIDYLKFKEIICQTNECAMSIKYNKVKYDIFCLSDLKEIIIYFENKNIFVQYKYNYDYNEFHVIREKNSKKDEYKVNPLSGNCLLKDCSLFQNDYMLFQNVLEALK